MTRRVKPAQAFPSRSENGTARGAAPARRPLDDFTMDDDETVNDEGGGIL